MALTLAQRDKRVIWHPYTHQKYTPEPIPIVKGEGVWLEDEHGNRYIDAISSWWVNVHGHGNGYIAGKMFEQALQLEQVIFAGFTHEPAVQLAERLLDILPGNYSRIFYSDNGSTATEVAVKMALQYWKNKEIPRTKVLALKNAYHGDTFGAMSFSGRSLFNQAFNDKLFEVVFANVPTNNNPFSIDGMDKAAAVDLLADCACVIYEPLIQGAGGMLMYEPTALEEFLKLCRASGVLCIADEVMTGFGRTGKMFASMWCNTQADIICLSKGLTGGTMALGVTACTNEVYEAFVDDDVLKTFYHGHSYTANPLACAAALASLDIFEDPDTMQNIARIGSENETFAKQLVAEAKTLGLSDIRYRGTIIAFDKDVADGGYTSSLRDVITSRLLSKQVYLRPLGNTVYLMPPYCLTAEQMEMVQNAVLNVLKDLRKEGK